MRDKSTVNNVRVAECSMQRDPPGLANTSGILPFFSL